MNKKIKLLGIVSMIMISSNGFSSTNMVDSVSQYGITWHFDKPVETGRFITGDWWVIGPVTVISVDPEPGAVTGDLEESVKSQYGAEAAKGDNQMRNGSMIPEKSTGKQGYDSRLNNYVPEMTVKFPVVLNVNTSLVSTISNPIMKTEMLAHKIMWTSEKKGKLVLKTAAVLTVLAKVPPADAFRPPYCGTEKPIYTFSQIDSSRLLNLDPPENMPSWEQFERYFQRPWLDHMTSWLHQMLGPSENQVNYGREFTRLTGMAGLMLNTKAADEQKKRLIIGLTQLGIDLKGVIEGGRRYYADGGHYSGRKFPILFAGAMLNDKEMLNPTELSNFAEDIQTYYGNGWAGQKALFQIGTHTGPKPPHEHKSPDTWDTNNKRAEGYRVVNSVAWPSTALAVRFMGLIPQWNHDAFFDYNDRWMSPGDPYAENYAKVAEGKYKRNQSEAKTYDRFIDSMWDVHRKNAPEPDWAGNCRMWIWDEKVWRPNSKPSEPAEKY